VSLFIFPYYHYEEKEEYAYDEKYYGYNVENKGDSMIEYGFQNDGRGQEYCQDY
jgi:hypothetical protein